MGLFLMEGKEGNIARWLISFHLPYFAIFFLFFQHFHFHLLVFFQISSYMLPSVHVILLLMPRLYPPPQAPLFSYMIGDILYLYSLIATDLLLVTFIHLCTSKLSQTFGRAKRMDCWFVHTSRKLIAYQIKAKTQIDVKYAILASHSCQNVEHMKVHMIGELAWMILLVCRSEFLPPVAVAEFGLKSQLLLTGLGLYYGNLCRLLSPNKISDIQCELN